MILVYLLLAVVGFLYGKWIGALFLPGAVFYFKNQAKIHRWLQANFSASQPSAKHLVMLLGHIDSLSVANSTAASHRDEHLQAILTQLKAQFPAVEPSALRKWLQAGQRLEQGQAEAVLTALVKETRGQHDVRQLAVELAYLAVVQGAGFNVSNRAFIGQLLKRLSVSSELLHDLEKRFAESQPSGDKAIGDYDIKQAYQALGLSVDATPEAIKQARKKMLNTYHPDKLANSSLNERQAANRRVDEINKAYKKIQQYRGFV